MIAVKVTPLTLKEEHEGSDDSHLVMGHTQNH